MQSPLPGLPTAIERPPPTLETPRLILRGHRREDLPDLVAMWGDPAVVEFIGRQTRDPQDTWFTLLRLRGLWSILGYGFWVVRERESEAFVGELGFADFQRGLPELPPEPEAGWALAASQWGRGYASEALGAAVAWLDAELGVPAVCVIEPAHAASLRVAARAGFAPAGQTTYRGAPLRILRRPPGGARGRPPGPPAPV